MVKILFEGFRFSGSVLRTKASFSTGFVFRV